MRALLEITAIVAALLCACGPQRISDNRPNIVMIMSDDMGYSDLGSYGGEIDTPNLDRLAREGLRFTRYYTNNMCVPTRASLMTGIYSTVALADANTLRQDAITVAEILGHAGYSTHMAGKWHLSQVGDHQGHPRQRGFDQFYGTILGATSYFAPISLMRDNENAEADWKRPDYFYTDAITGAATAYIRESAGEGNPFFIYVAYTAAHWPLHAPAEDIKKYQGRYAEGWDILREKRHARMKKLGVVNPDWKLSPRNPHVPAWDRTPHQEWQQRRMEVYAAQVDRMDRGIGHIIEALEETGELDHTLIAFQVDNGGCHVEYEPDRKGPFLPETTRDGRPMRPGNLPDIMPGPEDTFQSYGYGWANLSNTPFRMYKKYDHEGGTHVPLIVRWPGVIPNPGSITDQVAHVIDLTPTFLDAAGVKHPNRFHQKRTIRLDGKSLVPVLRGEQRRPHDALFWKWSQGRAVRRGRWKLVRIKGQPWELYDIETDGTELNDLASEREDLVGQLERLWESWNALTAEQRLNR